MKKAIIPVFLILLTTVVAAESSLNFVTVGFGDRRWCVINGNCQLADLIVTGNLTVLGSITNVSVIQSDDWGNVTINESQIVDLRHQNYSLNISDGTNLGAVFDNEVLLVNTSDDNLSINVGSNHITINYDAGAHTPLVIDSWVNETGDTMTGQLIVKSGNGQIVSSNSAGAIDVQTSAEEAGAISFGNSADIGLSRDGVVGEYNYNGAFIIKQKTSKPVEDGEFIFIEQAGDWRFALPKALTGLGTYNPRSMIVAGASVNNASNFQCSHWNFNHLDCATDSTGADLGVQDDLQANGIIYAGQDVRVNNVSLCMENGTNCLPSLANFTNDPRFIANNTDATLDMINVTEGIIFSTKQTNITGNNSCITIRGSTSTITVC